MKKFATIALTGLCVMIFMSSAFAQLTEHDTLLAVSRAAHPPVIDAIMDTIWHNVPQQEMTTVVDMDNGNWDDWYDNAAAFRVMYDDTYFYIWNSYFDEELIGDNDQATNQWNDDSFEFYFDADYSRMSGGGYDQVDDIQCRYNYGYEEDTWLNFGGTGVADRTPDFEVWPAAQVETDLGWDAEIAVALADIQLDPDPGWILGFEFDGNDDDDGEDTRETKLKWWEDHDNAWNNPDQFGAAQLVARTADDILDVNKTNTAPVIDGEMDDVWKEVASIHGTHILSYDNIDDFDDIGLDWKTMWDASNIYYFLEIRDDVLVRDGEGNYQDDGFELYFDGDYSHTQAWDSTDDICLYWGYHPETVIADITTAGSTTAPLDLSVVQSAAVLTDMGMNVEVAVPLDLLSIPPTAGHIYGIEVDYNDDDDEGDRDTKVKTYSLEDNTWQYANLMVQAMLKDDMPVGVAKDKVQADFSYSLAQNYPNPFNPTTNIDFTVAKNAQVNLVVYNLLGEEVATLVNEVKPVGQHTVTFSGAELPSGVYFYKLDTGSQIFMQKMLLVK